MNVQVQSPCPMGYTLLLFTGTWHKLEQEAIVKTDRSEGIKKMPIDKRPWFRGRTFRIGLAAAAMMLTIGCTVDSGSDDIYTSAPLHKAVIDEHPSKVRQLLAAGADPNARINAPGWYMSYGNSQGTSVRADMDGMTPLHLAVMGEARHIPIAEQLLDAGADPNAESYAGDTPMDIVNRSGRGALKGLLRSYGGR